VCHICIINFQCIGSKEKCFSMMKIDALLALEIIIVGVAEKLRLQFLVINICCSPISTQILTFSVYAIL